MSHGKKLRREDLPPWRDLPSVVQYTHNYRSHGVTTGLGKLATRTTTVRYSPYQSAIYKRFMEGADIPTLTKEFYCVYSNILRAINTYAERLRRAADA